VPLAVNVPVTVWLAASVPPVEPDVVAALNVKLTNVFAPVIEFAQLAGNVTVPKDKPPPAKVLAVLVMLIVEDAALRVRLVDVANERGVPPPKVNVVVPSVIERTLLLLLEKAFILRAKLPVLNEPALTVIFDKTVIAAPSVHPPPTPSNIRLVSDPNPPPAKVTVFPVVVAAKFNVVLLLVQVMPVAANVTLPKTYIVPATGGVSVTLPTRGPATVQSLHVAPVDIVTVYKTALDALSNTTSSIIVGTPALPDPPDVNDQLVAVVVSQVPDPPTQ
jgi:hypothetical protein